MLDKAIQSGKEHRKQYRGCKAVDRSCRNHGSDGWMTDNRMYSTLRDEEKNQYSLKEDCSYFDEETRYYW